MVHSCESRSVSVIGHVTTLAADIPVTYGPGHRTVKDGGPALAAGHEMPCSGGEPSAGEKDQGAGGWEKNLPERPKPLEPGGLRTFLSKFSPPFCWPASVDPIPTRPGYLIFGPAQAVCTLGGFFFLHPHQHQKVVLRRKSHVTDIGLLTTLAAEVPMF